MLRREGDLLLLEGPVTLETVPGLVSAAEAHLRQGAGVIDLKGVTEIDSSAVALALEWVRQAERAGVPLRLINVPPSMQNLATLYGVSELLHPASA
jgi:phospholipid transport system transporter-binding protein